MQKNIWCLLVRPNLNILEKVIQTCASVFSLYFAAKIGKRRHMAKKIVQQIVKCATYEDKQLFNLVY